MKTYIPIFKADGGSDVIEGDSKNLLQALYDGIGCYTIETVRVHPSFILDNLLLVLDEEGKLVHKPMNLIGTVLYNNRHDFIVGDVAIVRLNKRGDDFEGFDSMEEAEKLCRSVYEYLFE